MTTDQYYTLAILVGALVLFIWGKWRYDLVAVLALITGVLIGIIPVDRAFEGFAHPAVMTVALVLILSRTVHNSGMLDWTSNVLKYTHRYTTLQIFTLTLIVTVFSAFMNNVAALALMMPIALQQAAISQRSPSLFMMPLSFGSLLGGTTTLIGTPPNIIVANYRQELTGEAFHMFDFSPVGLCIAAAGLIFMALIGWRLIPIRRAHDSAERKLFEIKDYVTEAQITEKSNIIGKNVWHIEDLLDREVIVVGIVRGNRKIIAPAGIVEPKVDDILILEGAPESLKKMVEKAGLKLIGTEALSTDNLQADEISLMEAVVSPDARLIGETARSLHLRTRFGVNLLAVSRQGTPIMERLARIRFRPGDVLLLQGEEDGLREAIKLMGCLPLAGRALSLGYKMPKFIPLFIFAGSIACVVMNILPIQIALLIAVTLMVVTQSIKLKEAYEAIDWPIIVLLGAMLPVGEAFENTGVTQIIATQITSMGDGIPHWVILTTVMLITMTLTDILNNAATALIMAPIAASIAMALGVNIDPFLIGVCVASSANFLTPIGHQSNALVMGPGGYKFGDYWRMGIFIEATVLIVAVPAILYFWPL